MTDKTLLPLDEMLRRRTDGVFIFNTQYHNGIVLYCENLIKIIPGQCYLVGSALYSLTRPRDIDIRLVVSDASFIVRFDASMNWFEPEFKIASFNKDESWWKWHEEEARITRELETSSFLKGSIDFQIIPKSVFDEFGNGKTKYILECYSRKLNAALLKDEAKPIQIL